MQPDGSRSSPRAASTFTLRNRDFNTLSFRSNVVLRWEWRPGSTLYLVWQQDRADSRGPRHAASTWATCSDRSPRPARNVFVVKTSFWIPIG